MLQNMNDLELITKPLASGMRKHAHVDTGYMRSSVYHKRDHAGADADYAGFEADRGGSHDFAVRAIEGFDIDEYLAHIVKPF
jgi:hypothetical protein